MIRAGDQGASSDGGESSEAMERTAGNPDADTSDRHERPDLGSDGGGGPGGGWGGPKPKSQEEWEKEMEKARDFAVGAQGPGGLGKMLIN